MPRLWDRSRQRQRTPFADLLTEYVSRHWPMRMKDLARETGLAATTISRYVNDGVVPRDLRVLEKIHAGTDIPLEALYTAVGIHAPRIEVPYPPPRRRTPQEPAQPIQTAAPSGSQEVRLAFLHDTILQVQRYALTDEQKATIIASTAENLGIPLPLPPLTYLQRQREEFDHDFISTMELPTMPPTVLPSTGATVANDEAKSHSQSDLAIKRK